MSPACRSLTGAWIETSIDGPRNMKGGVAPLRGRGLKPGLERPCAYRFCRSLTGAWIETGLSCSICSRETSLPYGGVD